MKYLAALVILGISIPAVAARYECVRWTWTGDVYERKVICLQWRDRDAPKSPKPSEDNRGKRKAPV